MVNLLTKYIDKLISDKTIFDSFFHGKFYRKDNTVPLAVGNKIILFIPL